MNYNFYIILGLFIFIPARASESLETDFYKINVFSIGFNGFVARKMPQQILYEKILSQEDSAVFFENAIRSPYSTPESKLYAACGLWEMKRYMLEKIIPPLTAERVSVLKADRLFRERFEQIFQSIKQHGCN